MASRWCDVGFLRLFAILAAKAVSGPSGVWTWNASREAAKAAKREGGFAQRRWRRGEGQGTAFVDPPRSLRLGVKICSDSFAVFAASREVVLLTPR